MTNANGNLKYNWAGSASSPIYYMENNTNENRIMRMTGNAFLRITPIKDLRIELSGSAQYYDKDSTLIIQLRLPATGHREKGQNHPVLI